MIEALQALRQRISQDPELIEFFTTHYGKTLKHSFGYKRAMQSSDYPVLSYVVSKAIYANARKPAASNEFSVSLVLGLLDKTVLDEDGLQLDESVIGSNQYIEFAGNVNTSHCINLILANFKRQLRIGDFYIASDFSVFVEEPNFPYFNTELTFILKRSV